MDAFVGSFQSKLLKSYDYRLDRSGVDGRRLASRLAAVAGVGLTENGGSRRIGFSREEREAKSLAKGWMDAAGLLVEEDAAGNVIGRLRGREDGLPAVLCGSHLDSVPEGGHFDGVLGVLAALEVVEAWKACGYRPLRPFEAIVFSDEEGSRFNAGLTGSTAMMGRTDARALASLRDQEGVPFAEAVAADGLSVETLAGARRDIGGCAAYAEVHVEQGVKLEQHGAPVGIVTGIVGQYGLGVTFNGDPDHAGSTPMPCRRDALVAASELVLGVERLAREVSPTAVATVGKLNVHPNGSNVIPGEVSLSVDLRDTSQERLDRLLRVVLDEALTVGSARGIAVRCEETSGVAAVPIAHEVQELQALSLSESGLRPVFLSSGAGHDAMVLGEHVPTAMFFVRSKGGVSHNPREWSSLSDCVAAVLALKRFVEHLQRPSLDL